MKETKAKKKTGPKPKQEVIDAAQEVIDGDATAYQAARRHGVSYNAVVVRLARISAGET